MEAPPDGSNLKKTFERAEVLGQWIESIEKNVVTIKQWIGRLDDMTANHKGKC